MQRRAELCISGALRTTAAEALNTILDLEPLDLLAKSWTYATALRLREATSWTTGPTGHSMVLTNQKCIPHTTDYVPPIVNFEKSTRNKEHRLEQPPTPNQKTPSIYKQMASSLTCKKAGKYSLLN